VVSEGCALGRRNRSLPSDLYEMFLQGGPSRYKQTVMKAEGRKIVS
jgi:hypothetical protein